MGTVYDDIAGDFQKLNDELRKKLAPPRPPPKPPGTPFMDELRRTAERRAAENIRLREQGQERARVEGTPLDFLKGLGKGIVQGPGGMLEAQGTLQTPDEREKAAFYRDHPEFTAVAPPGENRFLRFLPRPTAPRTSMEALGRIPPAMVFPQKAPQLSGSLPEALMFAPGPGGRMPQALDMLLTNWPNVPLAAQTVKQGTRTVGEKVAPVARKLATEEAGFARLPGKGKKPPAPSAAAANVAPEAAPKEPWQMRAERYVGSPVSPQEIQSMEIRGLSSGQIQYELQQAKAARQFSLGEHKIAVQKALSEGKPVPPEVLADYPDLKAQVETQARESFRARVAKDIASQPETVSQPSGVVQRNALPAPETPSLSKAEARKVARMSDAELAAYNAKLAPAPATRATTIEEAAKPPAAAQPPAGIGGEASVVITDGRGGLLNQEVVLPGRASVVVYKFSAKTQQPLAKEQAVGLAEAYWRRKEISTAAARQLQREFPDTTVVQEAEYVRAYRSGRVVASREIRDIVLPTDTILYHGTPKPFVGTPRTNRAKMGLSGPFRSNERDVFEGFYTTNSPEYATMYGQNNPNNVLTVRLDKTAKVLDLSDSIISQEVLGTSGALARSPMSSLAPPSKKFPFQKEFEDFAFQRMNEARLANGREPFTSDTPRWQAFLMELDPTNSEWNLEGLSGQYLEEFVKRQGYDAVKFGRETVVLNPAKATVLPRGVVTPTRVLPTEQGVGQGAAVPPSPATTVVEPPPPLAQAPPPVEPPKKPPVAEAVPPAPEPGFAANIRLSKYPEDLRGEIKKWADANPEEVQKARRGVRPDAQVLADAKALTEEIGGDFEKLQRRWKPGEAWNAEELVAIRGTLRAKTKAAVEAGKKARQTHVIQDEVEAIAAVQEAARIQEIVHGVTAEAGRALRSFRQEAFDATIANDPRKLEELLRRVGGRDHVGELLGDLSRLDPNNPAQVNHFIRNAMKPTLRDKLYYVFINSILSGPKTHIINALSNLATMK